MRGRLKRIPVFYFLAFLFILTACGAPTPTAELSPTDTPTSIPLPTPLPTPSPVDAVQTGDDLLLQSDFSGAWEAYEQAIAIDRNFAPAFAGQSLVYYWQGVQSMEALALAQKAAELAPENAFAQAVLAIAYLRRDVYPDAVETAVQAAELDPEDPFVQSVLAMAYLGDKQFEKAYEAAVEAHSLDPEVAIAHYALGRYYQDTADFARAREAIQRAVQIEPDFVFWQGALGAFWSYNERYEEASEAFTNALEIAPDHLPTILGSALMHVDQQDYSAAEAQLEKSLELAPDEPVVFISSGILQMSQGEFNHAQEQFNLALDLDPESYFAKSSVGSAYLKQAECEQAELQFQELATDFPNWEEPYIGRGFAELCAGDFNKALTHFREAARINPYSGDAKGYLGLGYSYQARWEEAREAYKEALSLNPAPSELHGFFGDDFWDQGMMEEAEAEYRLSIALNPYSINSYLKLAWLLIGMDQSSEAAQTVEKAAALNPDDQDVLRAQGYIYLLRSEPQKALKVLEKLLEDDPEDAFGHLLLGLTYRDLSEYSQAKKEIETYIALAGNLIDESEINRLNILIEALNQGYTLNDVQAVEEMDQFLELFLDDPPKMELLDLEEGRTMVVTISLTQADLADESYMMALGFIYAVESLYIPRMESPPENGLLIHLTQGGKDLFNAYLSYSALKQYADTLITAEEMWSNTEYSLVEDTVKEISIQKICNDMAEVRELEVNQTSAYQILTQAEVQEHLERSIDDQEQTNTKKDSTVLSMLGVISPDLNLEEVMIELYTEQIAGYYDTGDELIYLVEHEQPSTSDQLVLAHECVHMLQDQAYDLEKLDDPEYNDDQLLALKAVIEGDATLSTILYLEEFVPTIDQLESASQAGGFETEAIDETPNIINAVATFPYFSGLDFMLSLYGRDEWETVDMVYTDLPQSTEQILHPERYFDSDQPIEVKIPDLEASLGDTWRVIGSDVLGEFQLKMILQEYFGPLGAMEAAEGWGGDGYILLHNDSQNADVLILKTTWDDQDESDEFWDLFRTAMYHRTAYFERIDTLVGELPMRAWVGDLNSILAQQNGLDVNISIGPDIELLEIIMNAMSQ